MAALQRIALFSCLIAAGCNQSSAATHARTDEARGTLVDNGGSVRLPTQRDGALRVWPIGDSITEGADGGYRSHLYRLLRDQDIKVDYVGTLLDDSARIPDKDHEGHPGYTISNAQDKLDEWLKVIPKPDVVLVMLGTNDFAWWTNVDVAEHHGYFVELVNTLLARLPQSLLVVSTIPPQSPKKIETINLDRRKMTDEFNVMVRRWVPAQPSYGKRLFLADAARELELSDLADGIHPTRKGHEKLAKVWFRALQQALASEKADAGR